MYFRRIASSIMVVSTFLLILVGLSHVARILTLSNLHSSYSAPRINKNFRSKSISSLKMMDGSSGGLSSSSSSTKKVVVEVYVRRALQSAEVDKYQVSDPELLSPVASRSVARSVARSPGSLYREEERAESLDSPMTRVTDLVFNPVALIVGLYVFILGYGKLSEFLPKILRLFGGGSASSAGSAALTQQQLVALPYQIFECQVCGMQMRPAKGRADKIFGRDSFRCTRCGSKASSYFNIDDLTDPRAVERLDKIAREADEDLLDDGETDDPDPVEE